MARSVKQAAADPAQRPPFMAALLPVLNDLIRTGPWMWPADLDPGGADAVLPMADVAS